MEYEVQILQSPQDSHDSLWKHKVVGEYASVVECRHAGFKFQYSVMDVQVQVLSEVQI